MIVDSRNIVVRVEDLKARTIANLNPHEIKFHKLYVGEGGLIMSGDIDVGDNKIKFSNVVVFERSTGTGLEIKNVDETDYKELYFKGGWMYGTLGVASGNAIRTGASATVTILLQSHDGTAYVDNIKLSGGYVELYNAKLISDLDANSKQLLTVKRITGSYDIPIDIYGNTHTSPGNDAIRICTWNAAEDTRLARIVITGLTDTADIKIVNAYLDFNDQTLESTAGSVAGYIYIKVGGTLYKLAVYNVS